MAKDTDQELDDIFAHHNARRVRARDASAELRSAEADFDPAAAACLADVVAPALRGMAQSLNQRGVAARVAAEGSEVRIDIPVSRHVRLGHGFGGYPYLRARPDRLTRRIHFERNKSDSRGGSVVGAYPIAEVSAELVKSLVVDLVRELYGPL